MTKKIADIKAKVGEYTNREGATKGRWVDVGYVLDTGNGAKMRCYYPWINIAGIPKKEGYDSVPFSEFEVKDDKKTETHKGFDKQGDVARLIETTPALDDMNSDIPF